MEMRGVEPRTSHMRSERSTTELHPLITFELPILADEDGKTRRGQRQRLLRSRCDDDDDGGDDDEKDDFAAGMAANSFPRKYSLNV